MAPVTLQVAEMQGLYGPYTLTERVLQKIWLNGDFDRRELKLTDGRSVELLSPGRWNLSGGPDFLGARLRIGGRIISGDVEVHFHAKDWTAHGHGANPAFAGVQLHVVLFPPGSGEQLQLSVSGEALPTLVLLPILHRDLEEYASDDALEGLTERDAWRDFAVLAALPPAELQALVNRHAAGRWRQKCHYARLRIERLGWEDAAHHTALEILGYARNRAAMLAVAERHPLAAWRAGLPVETLLEEGRGYWARGALRPANHPKLRLRQYQDWVKNRPDWTRDLQKLGKDLSGTPIAADADARGFRREANLAGWRERLACDVCGGAVGGSRLDTLICDGFLPLCSVAVDSHAAGLMWQHWYLGDVPGQLRAALGRLGLAGTGAQPFSHGVGQGLLGWILARQARASGW